MSPVPSAVRALVFAVAATVIALAVAVPVVPAQDASFDMRAVTQDGRYFFEADGEENPTLVVSAGDEVTIDLELVGAHNIHVGAPVNERTEVEADTQQVLSFIVPEDAPQEIPYWCDPHRELGMEGVLRVEGAGLPAPTEEGTGDETGTGEGDPVQGGEVGGEDEPSPAPVQEGDMQDEDSEQAAQPSPSFGIALTLVVLAIALAVGFVAAGLGGRRG